MAPSPAATTPSNTGTDSASAQASISSGYANTAFKLTNYDSDVYSIKEWLDDAAKLKDELNVSDILMPGRLSKTDVINIIVTGNLYLVCGATSVATLLLLFPTAKLPALVHTRLQHYRVTIAAPYAIMGCKNSVASIDSTTSYHGIQFWTWLNMDWITTKLVQLFKYKNRLWSVI